MDTTTTDATGEPTTGAVEPCPDEAIGIEGLCFTLSTVGFGLSPAVVDSADLDLDGFVDVFAANLSVNEQHVLFGDGAGSFTEIAERPLAPVGQRDAAAADLNGDGIPELVGANLIVGYVTVHPGLGDRAFDSFTPVAAGSKPRRIELVDLNDDAALDLLAVSEDPGPEETEGLIIRLGDGMGGFMAPTAYAVGPRPYDLARGDVNGDGAADVVVTNYDSETSYTDVQVRYGDGLGGLTEETRVFEVAKGSRRVVLNDLDDDGALDILTASYESSSISFLPGDGAGEFAVESEGQWIPLLIEDVTGVYDLAARDMDLDGVTDLIAVHREAGVVSILRRDAGALSGERFFIVVGVHPLSMTIEDFNGDGRPDVAVANSFSNSLSLLLSVTP
ncbi:MAG: VCBS repeat-containing protein [Myxococcales bacterium]|nr:VCBS repeat-containing protein [Myxococcales bacterium]